jgi:hypothetical protein
MSTLTVKAIEAPVGFDLQMPASAVIDGQALTAYRSEWPQLPSSKNIILNGGMQIAQRGISFVTPANNLYTLDRWRANISGGGAMTVTQDTDVPTGQGFDKSIKLDVTTADASIGAGDFFGVAYKVEAYEMSQLEIGTANAKAITLSFWVKSTITGTYYVAFRNSAADRNYCASYTVSSADTWEKKTISITMDTSGTWLSGTNGIGMEIRFSFMAGSTYQGTANTWQAGNLFAASGIANGINSTSNNVYLTGVQLEVGTTATDWSLMARSYGEELALCQRYFQLPGSWQAHSDTYTATAFKIMHSFPVTMRASPTIGTTGTPTCAKMNMNAGGPTTISVAPTANSGGFNGTSYTTMATGAGSAAATNTPYAGIGGFTADAEL